MCFFFANFKIILFFMYRIVISLIIFFPSICFASSMKMIGEKGETKDGTKVINVKMFDNYYEPNEITVRKGETVKFIVKNMGELVHELNIATKEMHKKHQPEMAKMVENEILLADRIDNLRICTGLKKERQIFLLCCACAIREVDAVLQENLPSSKSAPSGLLFLSKS